MHRLKLAELTATTGALVLGVGLGTQLADQLQSLQIGLLLIGLALHGFGMWDEKRLEASLAVKRPTWVAALYWICWLLLGGTLALFAVR